jgi:hypothetical protein
VADVAQLVNAAGTAGPAARRALGLALAGAGVCGVAVGAALATTGAVQVAWLAVAAAGLLGAAVMAEKGRTIRQNDLKLKLLLALLASRLPRTWYLLGDLTVAPAWGEPVPIWAVAVGPGGLVVVEPCTATGEIVPCGTVWLTGRPGRLRPVPSPAVRCQLAAEALRSVAGQPDLPVQPMVVLTDLNSVYHPAETGALVVGAPHAAGAIRQCLAGQVLPAGAILQVVSQLSSFCA